MEVILYHFDCKFINFENLLVEMVDNFFFELYNDLK